MVQGKAGGRCTHYRYRVVAPAPVPSLATQEESESG